MDHTPPQSRQETAAVASLSAYRALAAELEAAPVVARPGAARADDGPPEPPPHDGPGDDRGDPHDLPPPRDPDSPIGGGRGRSEIWDGCPVIPLGVSGEFSWYLDVLGQLRAVKKHELQTMLHLFGGNTRLLAMHYPQYDKDGAPKANRFDQLTLSAAMMAACDRLGVWSPTGRVRGPGAWVDDDGGLILHAGDEVLIEGAWQPPGVYGGRVYPAADPVPRPAPPSPREGDPGREALDLIETWNWRRRYIDTVLMLGLACAMMMCGALDWRPVGWLTGDAATGKSTLQKFLLLLLGGEGGLLQAADATEAGIRSVVGYSSLPVAIDELEPDKDNPRKVAAVIELARRAASGGQIFRGSTDQKGHQSNATSAFLFSSILVPPMPAQDRSRLILLDLERIDPDAPRLKLDARACRRIGAQLRRRLLDGWPTWAERLELWRAALAEHGQTGRGADNYATVLAMADMALHPALPDREAMGGWAHKLGRAATEDSVEVGSNADDMLVWLLGQEFDVYRRGEKFNIAQWLMCAAGLPGAPHGLLDTGETDPVRRAEQANAKLAKVGLRVYGTGQAAQLFVAQSPLPGLCDLFEGSMWAGGVWAQATRRLPGATPVKHPATLAGQRTRGTMIPFASIPGLTWFPMDRDAPAPTPPRTPPEMEEFA